MEREEGELTDEDLEDVSDNSSSLSIPITLAGKSHLREPFRELSLTSISDDSDSLLLEKTSYRHISRDLYRKHSSHKHRKEERLHPSTKRIRRLSEKRKQRNAKDYSSVSSSSDDSNYKNKTILRQLRDAVRINRSQNLPNCSLRTRLKRMIEPVSQSSNSSDNDDNLEILRDQALQSKTKSDQNSLKNTADTNVNDEDLAQLRLIALKSAVIKKHAERRKRKEEQLKLEQQNAQENNENVAQLPDIESEHPDNLIATNIPNVASQQCSNNNNNNNNEQDNKSIEEDEDILRAMLLTSISRKIADTKSAVKQITVVNNHNRNVALPNNNKPNSLLKPNENNYKLPSMPINRFIINVNSDSETDSDKNETIIEKKAVMTLNPKSDIFDKSLSLFLQQARAKTEEEKTKHQSDISHLPRSQQIEYKRLKRKLQILTTRMKPVGKLKKLSGPDENKKTKLNYMNAKFNNKFVAINHYNTALPTNNNFNKFQEKINKDDRLLIKGKYEELTPLMSRVSEARNARDKAQAEVKRLINDLKLARAQLTTNHQEYTVLVQELVKAKGDIDKRVENQEKKIINKKSTICTSTPNKLIINDISCELSAINEQTKLQTNSPIIVQPLPSLSPSPLPLPLPLPPPLVEVAPIEIPVVEMMDIVDDDDDDDDIVPVPVPVPESESELNNRKEATILKYNSPLDHIQLKREQSLQNPLLELCPYDLLGVCRDSDCSYQHCGNAITELN